MKEDPDDNMQLMQWYGGIRMPRLKYLPQSRIFIYWQCDESYQILIVNVH